MDELKERGFSDVLDPPLVGGSSESYSMTLMTGWQWLIFAGVYPRQHCVDTDHAAVVVVAVVVVVVVLKWRHGEQGTVVSVPACLRSALDTDPSPGPGNNPSTPRPRGPGTRPAGSWPRGMRSSPPSAGVVHDIPADTGQSPPPWT